LAARQAGGRGTIRGALPFLPAAGNRHDRGRLGEETGEGTDCIVITRE